MHFLFYFIFLRGWRFLSPLCMLSLGGGGGIPKFVLAPTSHCPQGWVLSKIDSSLILLLHSPYPLDLFHCIKIPKFDYVLHVAHDEYRYCYIFTLGFHSIASPPLPMYDQGGFISPSFTPSTLNLRHTILQLKCKYPCMIQLAV